MKNILTTCLLLIYCLNASGQRVNVDTLFIPKGSKFSHLQNDQLKFPVVRTCEPEVDSSINTDLKNRFTNYDFPYLPTDSSLIMWAGSQIVYLGFEVTYAQNGFLSLNISAEGCGANCSGWTEYFTYSIITGKYVTLNEIVDTSGLFRTLVMADKDRQYEKQKTELEKSWLDNKSGLDEDTYKWALDLYDNCDNEFRLKTFSLNPDHLEIIEQCYLPNAIKNLTPTIELKYKYIDIKKVLKVNF